MAVVKPFRALRFDESVAGPLETLVAPPYDVIDGAQREELRARSPHNVVRLTLPDSEDEAARLLDDWRAEGALVEEPPAVWALEQDYVGPDGIARTRFGIVGSLKVDKLTVLGGIGAGGNGSGNNGAGAGLLDLTGRLIAASEQIKAATGIDIGAALRARTPPPSTPR